MPLAAILVLVCLVSALVWIVNRSEADQARIKLATDALWVEQTLRFQLSIDEDALTRLALDASAAVDPSTLDARARLHVANHPEVLSIAWFDREGSLKHAVPSLNSNGIMPLVERLIRSGHAVSARPVYSTIENQTVAMAIRLDDGGAMTMTISAPAMLDRHIPWWIAEQYGVEIVDSGGTVLAKRAKLVPEPDNPSHTILFDPPWPGTVLRIIAYDASAAFANTLLLAAILGLGLFTVLALLVLHRSTQRRRRAELRLQGEMAFRRSMEESLTVGLRAKDHQGRILYVNSAFCHLVGWPAAELVGHVPPMPYWSPDHLDETIARQKALSTGGAVSQAFETLFRRSDGSEINVQVYEAPLIDADGQHRGWMGSVIDITEAKQSARLARAQDINMARTGRLVTLGEMASTLAHELNQPLSAIAGYAAGIGNFLDRDVVDVGTLKGAVDKISLQASRAGQIIRRIQDFVKKREPHFSPLLVEAVITDTVGFMATDAADAGVHIITELQATQAVLADRILLEQVLINLLRNGMEAMADHQETPRRLVVRLWQDATRQVVIEVEDQGHGISADMSERLFYAFTTTKTEGMGMGLNICRTIVEMHRGKLSHRPAAPRGTVFVLTLPLADSTGRGDVKP